MEQHYRLDRTVRPVIMPANWQIEEYEDIAVPEDELADVDIEYLRENLDDEIDIEPPWAETGGKWRLYNNGYIGHTELPSGKSIELSPRTNMDDVFGMLEYAYDLDVFQPDESLYESDTVQGFYDKIANILAQNVNKRRRQGLYRTYQDREERSERVRGRIDIRESLREPWNPSVKVRYREMTADNEENQILLYTLNRICRSSFAQSRTLERARKAIRSLRDAIEYREFEASDCTNRQYNRLNNDYERLHALCRLILETSGPTQDTGDARMIPYIIRTFDLYELFVYRWILQNIPDSYSVEYQESAALGDTSLNYKIDNVIRNRDGDPVCVIDTKYREPDSGPKPEEISQALGYAKRMCVDHAFLVYPSSVGSGFPLELGDVAIHTEEFSITGDLESNGREFLRRVSSTVGLPSLRA